jgi:hypothetical protein
LINANEDDDVAGLWYYYSPKKEAFRYPHGNQVSPDLLLSWTRVVSLEQEVPRIKAYISSLKQNDTVELDLIDHHMKVLESAEQQL